MGLKLFFGHASISRMNKKTRGHCEIKILQLRQSPIAKYGKAAFHNQNFGHYENDTVSCLTSFGFDVETLSPSNIPKSKNPDLYMLGTFWEIKTLLTANENTIKTHFRKAVKQAGGKAVFDLRYYEKDVAKIKQYIMDLFASTRGMRRIILIEYAKKEVIAIDLIK